MLETKPIRRDPIPCMIAGYDTETHTDMNRFILGSVIYDDPDRPGEHLSFQTQDQREYDKFLRSKTLGGYQIFGTNNEFDFFVSFGQEARPYFFPFFSKSHLIFIKVMEEGIKQRKFLGTENFFPASVERLGKAIGIPKLPHPEFLGKRPKNQTEWAILKRYNLRDSLITYTFMKRLHDLLLSMRFELKNTIAGTSLWGYRRNFQRESTWQPSVSIMNHLLKAYYGGRVECFNRGRLPFGEWNYYDVNSLYPYAMLGEFPKTETLFRIRNPKMRDIHKYTGVSRCVVISPDNLRYPVLPFRTDEKKLIFPVGSWEGWFAHPELILAERMGYTILPKHTIAYKKTYKPFEEYIRTMYQKRIDDPANSIFWKILMNSLYGRYAMRWGESYQYVPFFTIDRLPETFQYESSGWAVFKETSEPSPFVNPIFSIYVTAYGRCLLYDLISKHDAVYCDTDSLITKDEIDTGTALGELKREYRIKSGVIVKPKLYFIEDADDNREIVRSKGLRIKDGISFNHLMETRKGVNMRFAKFKASLRRGLAVNRIYHQNLNIDLEDDKRSWERPFSEREWQDSTPHIVINGGMV